jgi:hypothetical protein
MMIKVGQAGDWDNRARGYNVGHVEPVRVAYRVKVDKRMFVERCLKRALAENRWHPLREIYRVTVAEAKRFLTACDGISGPARGTKYGGGGETGAGAHFMAFSDRPDDAEVLSRFEGLL